MAKDETMTRDAAGALSNSKSNDWARKSFDFNAHVFEFGINQRFLCMLRVNRQIELTRL
ncbi:MAG: hypothetical protein FWH25_00110 [Syntrophorhabdaceae bacterium]|nr:hypothetical protein [Syntrophorhabdaceae bacterium]